jgi:hypothetical protein
MKNFLVYDAAGDEMVDDCADLGMVEAANFADALAQAQNIWPGVAIRIAVAEAAAELQ